MSLSSHQSAKMKNDEWLTPTYILRTIGEFDLYPCPPIVRPWDTAAQHYTVRDDGLSKPWAGRVWLNPPYETVWGNASAVLFIKERTHFHFVDGRRADFNSGAPMCLVAYGSANEDCLRSSGLGFVASALRW